MFQITAHIGEGQHRNRRLVRQGKRRTDNRLSGRRNLAFDPVCLDRLSDILHLLLAEIDEPDRQLRPDVISNNTRNADAARLRQSLQAGGDIYAITKEVVALHHDVADVDANAKTHLLTGRSEFSLAMAS